MAPKNDYLSRYNYNPVYGNYNRKFDTHTPQINNTSWCMELGTVQNINEDDYSCWVDTDSGKSFPRVNYLSPWFSQGTGAGLYHMPESGARVLLGQSSNGEWYILGFAPLQTYSDNYKCKNGRRDLQRGDFCVSTAYGNYIEIRKNAGYIEVHNNEACKIVLQSQGNQIFIHSQRLLINNSAGTINMTVNDKGEAVTVGLFKMKVDDDENFVKIMAGSIGLVNSEHYTIDPVSGEVHAPKVIFSINICNKFSLTVDTAGNFKTYANSHEHLVEKDHVIEANGIIRDMAAVTIEHLKGPGRALTGLVDSGISTLAPYAPSQVNQVAPPPPNNFDQVNPPPGGGSISEGLPPDIDPNQTPAPLPVDGGHIVIKKYAEWNPKAGQLGNKCIMTIYNKDKEVTGSFQCVNGPWGGGKIPFGTYTVHSLHTRSEPAGMVVLDPANNSIFGWGCVFNNMYDPRLGRYRTGIMIHPDGNKVGTNGCFGITGGVDVQRDCFNKLKAVFAENGGKCKVEYIE